MSDRDGGDLLTSSDAGELLRAFVEHRGGRLVDWDLDHVDADPGRATTATYQAVVDWPYGRREELLGASARASGLNASDRRAVVFDDGRRQVAVWQYPDDPDLPGLTRAAYPGALAEVFNECRVTPHPVAGDELELDMIGYRPRRRAVLEARVPEQDQTYFVKVLRERQHRDTLERHRLLLDAGVPAPEVAASTPDHLLILRQLRGRPLAEALFEPEPPCTAEQLIDVLDSFPPAVAGLRRRPSWSDAVTHYAGVIARSLPPLESRLQTLAETISAGLRDIPEGHEPTHGDFHEGQIFVADGGVSGVLDVDTIGPGRRADDLACMLAHLSTIQHMNGAQRATVHGIIRSWTPVFDERVDPVELRLRAAAVIVSLATGPYRGQEPEWERETARMIAGAEALVNQVS